MHPKKPEKEADPQSQVLQALEEFNQDEIARQQEKLSKEHKKDKKKKFGI